MASMINDTARWPASNVLKRNFRIESDRFSKLCCLAHQYAGNEKARCCGPSII